MAINTTLSPTSTTGWTLDASPGSNVNIQGQVIRATIGGGATSPTIAYAEGIRSLVAQHGVVVPGAFVMSVTFSLPNNFYAAGETDVILAMADNTPATLNGQPVGSATDRWRVFLGMERDSGQAFFATEYVSPDVEEASGVRVERAYPWRSDARLPTGQHTLTLNYDPGVNNDGSYVVTHNGTTVAAESHTALLPSGAPWDKFVITTLRAGLRAQRANIPQVSVDLRSLTFTTPV